LEQNDNGTGMLVESEVQV